MQPIRNRARLQAIADALARKGHVSGQPNPEIRVVPDGLEVITAAGDSVRVTVCENGADFSFQFPGGRGEFSISQHELLGLGGDN